MALYIFNHPTPQCLGVGGASTYFLNLHVSFYLDGRYRAPKLPVVSIGTTFGPYGVSLVVTHPATARPSASTDSVLRSATMVAPIALLSILRAAHFGLRSTPTP